MINIAGGRLKMIECIKTEYVFTPIPAHQKRFDKVPNGVYILEAVNKDKYILHKKVKATERMLYASHKYVNAFKDFEEFRDWLKYKLRWGKIIYKSDTLTEFIPITNNMEQSMKKKLEYYNKIVPFVANELDISEYDVKTNWANFEGMEDR
jgi:hypothetical protein